MTMPDEFWIRYKAWEDGDKSRDFRFEEDELLSLDNEDLCFLTFRHKKLAEDFQLKDKKIIRDKSNDFLWVDDLFSEEKKKEDSEEILFEDDVIPVKEKNNSNKELSDKELKELEDIF